jgi:hypothetical protein
MFAAAALQGAVMTRFLITAIFTLLGNSATAAVAAFPDKATVKLVADFLSK